MKGLSVILAFVCIGVLVFKGCVDYDPIDLDGGKDCIPDCEGKCCGSDGCGGKCGDYCSDGYVCNTGTCECESDVECHSNADCPEGFWCDRTVFECVEIECIPNCSGKCCGSDGCDGTCPDVCPAGYMCDPATCRCDPVVCTRDADCMATQCCIDFDCVYMDCDNLQCGPDPVCGKECGPCPPDMTCVTGWCVWVGSGQPGDPCTFDTVNENAGFCLEGLLCLGIPADGTAGTCPGGSAEECVEMETVWNPDCVYGNCGVSFCAEECGPEGYCPEGFEPQDVNGTCFCIPV